MSPRLAPISGTLGPMELLESPLSLAAVGLAALLLLLLGGYGVPYWIRSRSIDRLRGLARGKLVLTYDDGPGRSLEPALVELLERHSARATFFWLGARTEAHAAHCEELVRAGHEVGCHSFEHLNAWKALPWRAVADIDRGLQALAPWLHPARLFRPPNGKLTLWTWLALRQRGCPIVHWTHDSKDTRLSRPQEPAEALLKEVLADGGGVVLLHSFDRRQPMGPVETFVLEVTEQLLEAARERQWQVCTVTELLGGSSPPHPR